MMDLYFQMGLALVVVIGMIYLLGVFMKKRQTRDGLMRILGWQSLGPKKGLAMVKVGGEVLLMAVTATDVKLLKTLEADAVDAEAGHEPIHTAPPALGGVADKLRKLKALKDTLYAVQ